ncbi:hypothetical protein [Terribacillus sp. DMT04]|uniref:hypothetical protein n=1 Tax=Terribacillus sp. DMT04 TaxID=2850441 RepID=UPI001C2C69C5|nr:hypothetical protein [Terribacillus sp. DMT04]QXE01963.1 hypothetical protein KS242_01535 [Terribacillus sp. DMT04]
MQNKLEEAAQRHDISLKAATLQFSTALPTLKAVIPGSTRPGLIKEDLAVINESRDTRCVLAGAVG